MRSELRADAITDVTASGFSTALASSAASAPALARRPATRAAVAAPLELDPNDTNPVLFTMASADSSSDLASAADLGGDLSASKERMTASGLRITDLEVGSGAEAVAGQTVTVNYRGTLTNGKQFSLTSYNRATGLTTVIPGTTWVDTSATAQPTQQNFYFGISRDGVWAAIGVKDSNTTPGFAGKLLAFRTDGTQPAVDISPAVWPTTNSWFDGSILFTNDFLLVAGSYGWHWTSATNPTTLQPLALPSPRRLLRHGVRLKRRRP